MIFTNQDTAKKFRLNATEQLNEDIQGALIHLRDSMKRNPDLEISDETLRRVARNALCKESRIYNALLYKSGIVQNTNMQEHYPLYLYFDNSGYDLDILAPFKGTGYKYGMFGGISVKTGQIST